MSRCILGILGVVVFCSASALAGSVGVTRVSTLEIEGRTSDDDFLQQSENTDFTLFDETISDSIFPPAGGITQAQASQVSDVDENDVSGSAEGSAQAQVAEFDAVAALASSTFLFDFDVFGLPEILLLTGRVQAGFDASARVRIEQVDDPKVLFEHVIDFGEDREEQLDLNLTLTEGRYRVFAGANANGTPTLNRSSYDVTFTTTPIPLPPAVWAGLIGIAASVIGMRFMRRLAK